MLNFLGRDIGGYDSTPVGDEYSSAGSYDVQGKGKTGITWGQFLSSLNSNAGTSQSPPIGGLMQSQFPGAVKPPQTAPIMNINSQLPMQEEKQQGQSDWQSILRIIMAMYGGGGAGGASFTGSGIGTPIT